MTDDDHKSDQEVRLDQAMDVYERIYGNTALRDIGARGYRTHGMRDFTELTIAHCMVDAWNRPGLDLRSRSIAQIAGLMCMRQWEELEAHMKLGLRNGLTPDEIMEIVLQMTVYGGQAIGHSAYGIAARVFKEAGIDVRREPGQKTT